MFKHVNRRKQGDIGVAAAVYYYTAVGSIVSVPQTEATRYDLLVDDGTRVARVQCKTSAYLTRSGRYEVNLATCGHNLSPKVAPRKFITSDEVDIVFIWLADGTMYEMPVSEVEGRKVIIMTPERREQYEVRLAFDPIPAAKTKAPRSKKCVDCDAEIDRRATRCRSCSKRAKGTKAKYPSMPELKAWVERENLSAVGRALGVSATAVREYIRDNDK